MKNISEGEILSPLSNTMGVKYTVIGNNVSDTYCEINITIRNSDDALAEITPRVGGESVRSTVIDVKYGSVNDTLASIHPFIHSAVLAEISILAGNRMSALFEIKEPPKLTTKLKAIEDSFTNDKFPYDVLNYGNNNSLLVGTLKGETYESFLRFDLSTWDKKNVIIEAKLKLYLKSSLPEDFTLFTNYLKGYWTEYSITHQNAPDIEELITDVFTLDKTTNSIEFDFTKAIQTWIRDDVNDGFVLRTITDSLDHLGIFYSSETSRSPELIVTYYDSRVYSASRTQTLAELYVVLTGDNDISAEVTVSSAVKDSDTFAQIYVHRYEDPLDSERLAEITATRTNIESEVSVSIWGESYVSAEVIVQLNGYEARQAEIIISKPFINSELFVPYQSDRQAELLVYVARFSSILCEVSVSRSSVPAEIDIKYKTDRLAEITIEVDTTNDIASELTVTRDSVEAGVCVKYRKDRLAEVAVSKSSANEIPASITVTVPEILCEVSVMRFADSDTLAEVTPRLSKYNEIQAQLSVSIDRVMAEITVVEKSDIQTELFVKYRSDTEAEIMVLVHDSRPAEINVIKTNSRLAEVAVTRQQIHAEIMIPYYIDDDVNTEITIRVLDISDRLSIITVRSKGGAYAFII